MLPLYVHRAASFTLEVGVRGLILLLAACVVGLLLRRSSAAVRSLLWRLSLYGLGALPLLSMTMPPLLVSVPVPTARMERTGTPALASRMPDTPLRARPRPDAGAIRPISRKLPAGPMDEAAGSVPLVSLPALASSAPSLHARLVRLIAPSLLTLWTLGALLLLSRCAANAMALRRFSRQSAASEPLVEAANEAKREMGIRTQVAVHVASQADLKVSPMTWGVFRPVLLLPYGTEMWPEGRLRTVFLHELAHIARGDWAAKVVADVVCALYWPNPLVWIAAGQMRRESEIACDDRVLGCGVRASDYAAHLLEIVRMRKNAVSLPAGAIAMAEPSLLDTRLRAALDPDRPRRQVSAGRHAVIAITFVLALLPLGALQFTRAAAVHAATVFVLPSATASEPPAAYPDLPGTVAPVLIQHSLPMHTVPGTVPQEPQMAPHKIAWGRSVRSLQVGIERTDGRQVIPLGQRTGFRLWIRNTGKHTVLVRYLTMDQKSSQSNPFFWNITVANNENILISPQLVDTGERSSSALTVKPGEQRTLPMVDPAFVVSPPGNSAVVEPTAFLSAGKKQVQVFPFVALAPEDAWMQKLGTGKIVMEVTQGLPGNMIIAPLPPSKPETRPIDKLQNVAWGAPADGLQAGVRIVGKKRRFIPGERVPLECYIRNITDQDIACSYAAKLYSDQLPVVHDAANPGVDLKMKGVFLTGIDPAFLLLLKAHETVIFEHPGFLLGAKPLPVPEPNHVPRGFEQYQYLERPAAGQYTVQQPFAYHISTAEEVKRLAIRSPARDRIIIEPFAVTLVRADGSRYNGEVTTIPFYNEHSTLSTGAAPFTITADGKSATPIVLHLDAAAAALEAIAWGEASGGLQAGLRAPNGRKRYPLGSTVAMDYIIRNVGDKEILFEHDAFPGVAGIIPEVFDSSGKAVHTFGFPIGATNAVKRETLRPGEKVVIGQTAMGIAADGAPWYERRPGSTTIKGDAQKMFAFMDALPGSYRIRHLYTVYTRPGFAKLVLYTGYLPLEVFDPVARERRVGTQGRATDESGRSHFSIGEYF